MTGLSAPGTVVVGAGQAGLAVSWHLRRLGADHVVLEQGTIADTWRTGRWDSFRLNTPAWSNLLPGETRPMEPPGGFHSHHAWADHLVSYAASNALPVQEQSPVIRLARGPAGDDFEVEVGGIRPRTVRARNVVVASGMQRVPRMPPLAAALAPSARSIHSRDYRSPGDLPTGGVLVVGGAQSGCQIAEDLLDSGRPVWLAASAAPRIPRRYRGRDIFEWLIEDGFVDQTLADLPDPAMRWQPQPNISGVGPLGRTLSLQAVAARGATLTGRVASIEGAVVRFAPDLAQCIRAGDRGSAMIRGRVDGYIMARGIAAPEPELDEADRAVDAPEAWPAPERLDLAANGVSSVIWATGFGPDVAWIDLPMPMERGMPMHTDGELCPGVWFVGIPWMRRRKSGIIFGADEDGALVAERAVARAG